MGYASANLEMLPGSEDGIAANGLIGDCVAVLILPAAKVVSNSEGR